MVHQVAVLRSSCENSRRSGGMHGRIAATLLCMVLGAAGALADEWPPMSVSKTPTCGCCTKWVEHVQASGITVSVREMSSTSGARATAGVPWKLGSCHTAVIGDYWVEGHVPAEVIQRLLSEAPADIAGLAVPGMPIGSPGMEGPNPQTYDVLAVSRTGEVEVYATVAGAAEP